MSQDLSQVSCSVHEYPYGCPELDTFTGDMHCLLASFFEELRKEEEGSSFLYFNLCMFFYVISTLLDPSIKTFPYKEVCQLA
jgi:hypothetical protein